MKCMYKHKVLKIAHHDESAGIQIPEETLEQANDIIKIEGFHLHIIVIDAVLLFKSETGAVAFSCQHCSHLQGI